MSVSEQESADDGPLAAASVDSTHVRKSTRNRGTHRVTLPSDILDDIGVDRSEVVWTVSVLSCGLIVIQPVNR